MRIIFQYISILSILLLSCKEQIPLITIEKHDAITFTERTDCQIRYELDNKSKIFNANIKYRGGFSIGYPKLSFGIELDKKFKLGNLPNDDDWILNASYIDKTFMRHKVSYDLYRQMNLNNQAAKSTYVNVKLNQENQGLYILMQEINGSMLELNKTDTMAMLFKDPVVFFDTMPQTTQDSTNYFQQKFPKIGEKNHQDYLFEFHDFLLNSSDSLFQNNIENWVDIQNIIDWHLMIWLTNNSDGILKNFYLYKLDEVTPFRIAIWDYDHSFGRDGDNEYNMMDRPTDIYRNILLSRLMDFPFYQEQLEQKWWTLRENKVFSEETIFEMIAKNEQKIEGSLSSNIEIWGLENGYYDNNSYKQEIAVFKEFTILRLTQLDDYFSKEKENSTRK